MIRANEISSQIGERWPAILQQLGIAPQFLQNRHGPCPSCGGKDRYRFENRRLRGDFFCNQCGAGDGFTLLQRAHGWDFRTARDRVLEAAGLHDPTISRTAQPVAARQPLSIPGTIARPTARVKRLRNEVCRLEDCEDAVAYLKSRQLWPPAAATTLRAHPGCEYFDAGQRVDRFPALIAEVRDAVGELVTMHATFLSNGSKLASHEPRKILSPMVGRESCAVRLYPLSGDSMGISEGIETAIAAAVIHQMPVWSAINAGLLAKFTPPTGIKRLILFADRDVAGLEAASKLMERLQGQLRVEIRTPPAPAKDWNDVLKLAESQGN